MTSKELNFFPNRRCDHMEANVKKIKGKNIRKMTTSISHIFLNKFLLHKFFKKTLWCLLFTFWSQMAFSGTDGTDFPRDESSQETQGTEEFRESSQGPSEKLLIMGHPLSSDGLAQPSDVLYGEELDRRMADTLGDFLAFKPGLSTTSFGPGVGRPIIHGFDGIRVKIVQDQVDTMDLSASSGDHALSTSPLIANEIEILKGANTLFYGPGAIGGVVNVSTNRVPTEIPGKFITGKIDLRAADNGGAKQEALRLDGGQGFWAWHFDHFFKESKDVDIPGFAHSSAMRALKEEEEKEEEHENEGGEPGQESHPPKDHLIRNTLPQSKYQTDGLSVGVSFIDDQSNFVGISLSQFNKEYDLPGLSHAHESDHHGEEEEGGRDEGNNMDEAHHEEGPYIDLDQMRVDMKAAFISPLPGWKDLKLDVAFTEYKHSEIEDSGEVGTQFNNDAWEMRWQANHESLAQWHGALGIQARLNHHIVSGEEALTPPVDTKSYGVFWVGQRNFGKIQWETGLRLDQVKHFSDPEEPGKENRQSFTGPSASLGLITPLPHGWKINGQWSYASRAPLSQELFSNGPHFASSSFEVGDIGLNKEIATNFSTTLSYKGAIGSMIAEAYVTKFANFIYPMATGEEREGLPVYQFTQNQATFVGFDVELSHSVHTWAGGQLEVTTFFDTITAKIDTSGNKNVPRIPPRRLGMGLQLKKGSFVANLDYLHAFAQSKTADHELTTNAYNDWRTYIGWKFHRTTSPWEATLFLIGHNLTNSEQRLHTSLIKDLAPQRGRTFEGGLRMTF